MKTILKQTDFQLFVATPKILKVVLSDEHKSYKWVNKRQFLNKEIVFCAMNKMKHLYKDIAYDKDIRKQFNRPLTYKFFNLYDF